ncbi:MAG: hypothetical protein II960_08060 [Synergistaceae bacterium]|nr:hypothetical protein [Synergistaceae bacterium]
MKNKIGDYRIEITSTMGVLVWSLSFRDRTDDTEASYVINVVNELYKALDKLSSK